MSAATRARREGLAVSIWEERERAGGRSRSPRALFFFVTPAQARARRSAPGARPDRTGPGPGGASSVHGRQRPRRRWGTSGWASASRRHGGRERVSPPGRQRERRGLPPHCGESAQSVRARARAPLTPPPTRCRHHQTKPDTDIHTSASYISYLQCPAARSRAVREGRERGLASHRAPVGVRVVGRLGQPVPRCTRAALRSGHLGHTAPSGMVVRVARPQRSACARRPTRGSSSSKKKRMHLLPSPPPRAPAPPGPPRLLHPDITVSTTHRLAPFGRPPQAAPHPPLRRGRVGGRHRRRGRAGWRGPRVLARVRLPIGWAVRPLRAVSWIWREIGSSLVCWAGRTGFGGMLPGRPGVGNQNRAPCNAPEGESGRGARGRARARGLRALSKPPSRPARPHRARPLSPCTAATPPPGGGAPRPRPTCATRAACAS